MKLKACQKGLVYWLCQTHHSTKQLWTRVERLPAAGEGPWLGDNHGCHHSRRKGSKVEISLYHQSQYPLCFADSQAPNKTDIYANHKLPIQFQNWCLPVFYAGTRKMLGKKYGLFLLFTFLIPQSDIWLRPQSGIWRYLICDSQWWDNGVRSCQLC